MCLRVHTTGQVWRSICLPRTPIVLSLENLPELATGRSRRSICTHGMADLLRRCHGCHSCAPFGRIRRLSLSNKYRQLSKLTAVKTRPLTAYGDLERLELSPDLVHRVIQLLGFIFQLLPLWIALEGLNPNGAKGKMSCFQGIRRVIVIKRSCPLEPICRSLTELQEFSRSVSRTPSQPVRTMREIPSHADST